MSNKELYMMLDELESKPFNNQPLSYNKDVDTVSIKLDDDIRLIMQPSGKLDLIHNDDRNFVTITKQIMDIALLIDVMQNIRKDEDE